MVRVRARNKGNKFRVRVKARAVKLLWMKINTKQYGRLQRMREKLQSNASLTIFLVLEKTQGGFA